MTVSPTAVFRGKKLSDDAALLAAVGVGQVSSKLVLVGSAASTLQATAAAHHKAGASQAARAEVRGPAVQFGTPAAVATR